MNFVPRVVDISHYTDVIDLKKTADAGVWGIICKATQGTTLIDNSYLVNKKKALDANLLWGAYHFATSSDAKQQVDWFLKHAEIDDKTLPCLDYETYPISQMSAKQMVTFLRYGEERVGRKFCIYSGNQLKENITKLNSTDQAYVCQHRLWLAQYSTHYILPKGFTKYWLWQYTGDGMGPKPHYVPGLGGESGGLDLNVYDGTRKQLTAEWTSVPEPNPLSLVV